MELQIEGKVALVTGGSKGLGLATAHALAREGVRVAICARQADALAAAAAEIGAASGHPVLAVAGDVTDPEDRGRILAAVARELGPIDILVNNAGGGVSKHLSEADPQTWESNRRLNVDSAIAMISAVVPHMRAQRWGRILVVAALSAKEPRPHQGISNTWKAALLAYAKSLATEVAADGVTVNTLLPGRFDTPQIRQRIPPEELERFISLNIPLRRLGRPEEMASLIAFLASDLAGFVTGTAIPVDGGMSRSLF